MVVVLVAIAEVSVEVVVAITMVMPCRMASTADPRMATVALATEVGFSVGECEHSACSWCYLYNKFYYCCINIFEMGIGFFFLGGGGWVGVTFVVCEC